MGMDASLIQKTVSPSITSCSSAFTLTGSSRTAIVVSSKVGNLRIFFNPSLAFLAGWNFDRRTSQACKPRDYRTEYPRPYYECCKRPSEWESCFSQKHP